ncbi:hypothetical protein [Granulicatella elegans]|uniref:hypothetical protein n=1 Tax=Granulicatella elegans TaxID=137732 RepID=UPI001D157E15|nr:hypothetical protein [Granulicatella elegans]UEA31538.1 hypothetical protein LK443_00665 [Granulicatella elegans]
MKKIFKIIGTVTLVIVALILVFLVVISFMAKEKNDQYYKYSNPRMPIESRYASMGKLEVLSKEYDSNDDLMKQIRNI